MIGNRDLAAAEVARRSYSEIPSNCEETHCEDNNPRPSQSYDAFLKGRVLSGYGSQDLEVGWIFQRFANRCMQVVSSRFLDNHAWYETQVEGGRIDQVLPGGLVIVCFSMLSPFVFPVVFGLAVFAFVPLGFLTVPYIRSIQRKAFVDNFQRQNNGATVVSPQLEQEESDEQLGNVGPKYSFRCIFFTAVASCWYLVVSVSPVLYLFLGPYTCATDVTCKDMSFHISPLLILELFACSAMAGFRFMRDISTSACDCACEHQSRKLMKHKYGGPLKQIITKLADMTDKLSYFPVFVYGESSEPDNLPQPLWVHVMLFLVAAIHALSPHIWMKVRYNQPWISADIDRATLFIMLLGTVAPFLEVRHFFVEFHEANEEFEDVIDELLIFIFISSPRSAKSHTILKRKYLRAVNRNDEWRCAQSTSLQAELGPKFAWLGEDEQRFIQGKTRKGSHYNDEQLELTNGICNTSALDELAELREFQVAFNFRRVEGIMLFRHMRRWLITDILNERLEVEHFINISFQAIMLGIVALLVAYFHFESVTAIWFMIPFDVLVLFGFSLRALNLCINANEYLFDETEILLLEWQDHCAQWKDPESIFEHQRAPAIAWLWDEHECAPQPVTLDWELQPETPETSKDISRALEVMLKRLTVLDLKQRILGLEVTKQLRNRIAATLGSVLAAIAVKLPSMIHESHLDEILQH